MTREEFTNAVRELMAVPVEGASATDKADLVRQALSAPAEVFPAAPPTDARPTSWTDSGWYDTLSKAVMLGCFLLALAMLADKAWWVQWLAGAGAAVVASVILFNVVRAVQPRPARGRPPGA
jgi:hypothetical protein